MRWRQYFHTIRYLKPIQIYARVWYAFRRPKLDHRQPPPIRPCKGAWCPGSSRACSLIQPNRFRFLNIERNINAPTAWNNMTWGGLWLFNLHYFDDLNARDADQRTAWHIDLIHRWIAENPPPDGLGWKPYTISLRIVNWIKWSFAGHPLSDEAIQSLALQTRVLHQRPEVHIQGNHLLANAKALIFVGFFFEGPEARDWLHAGLNLLAGELQKQILPDGGHYERSAMYQSVLLEDMLDLVNLTQAYSGACHEIESHIMQWRKTIHQMRLWLTHMTHPDGHIALFNDAALRIAPSLQDLGQYAVRLGIEPIHVQPPPITHLSGTGYIRVHLGAIVTILDVGEVCPPHLPAHAHADTLSFELSWHMRRVVVDSGTSCYDNSEERRYQRSTAAHNTVVIDGNDSSEVWDVFRVARRAMPFDLHIADTNDSIQIRCAHNGYKRLKGKPIHQRTFIVSDDRMTLIDTIQGSGVHDISAYLHFHPGIHIRLCGENQVDILENHRHIGVIRINAWPTVRLFESRYYPEFGKRERNTTLLVNKTGHLPFEGRIEMLFETESV